MLKRNCDHVWPEDLVSLHSSFDSSLKWTERLCCTIFTCFLVTWVTVLRHFRVTMLLYHCVILFTVSVILTDCAGRDILFTNLSAKKFYCSQKCITQLLLCNWNTLPTVLALIYCAPISGLFVTWVTALPIPCYLEIYFVNDILCQHEVIQCAPTSVCNKVLLHRGTPRLLHHCCHGSC